MIGTLHPDRHACGTVHLPNCYNPWSNDTYCVCGAVRWPGHVGIWNSRRVAEGWDRYFLHAQHCSTRVVPDEYAIEADPGKLTASFPTYATYDEIWQAVQGFVRRRPDLGAPRILWRRERGPWQCGEPNPPETHLCGPA